MEELTGNVLRGGGGFIWTANKAPFPYGTTSTNKSGAHDATFAGIPQPFMASRLCPLIGELPAEPRTIKELNREFSTEFHNNSHPFTGNPIY